MQPDFPASTPVVIQDTAASSRLLTRVYGWMFAGLLITAFFAFVTLSSPELLQFIYSSRLVFMGLIFGELALVAAITGLVGRVSAGTAAILFVAYSALNGLTLSSIFLLYTAGSLTATFLVCAGMFGAMSLFGAITRKSLDGLGSFCFMGLIGILLAGLVNLFLHSDMLSFVVSCCGVLVFTGLTAYDTSKIRQIGLMVSTDSEEGRAVAIRGALALYLDFINLFLMLLRLFGRRR